jgi:hypothetical protein
MKQNICIGSLDSGGNGLFFMSFEIVGFYWNWELGGVQ